MSGIMQMLLAAVQRVTDPFFEYVTLLLPGNGTNGAQNNTFLDGSTNNFTITRNGNTTQGTFSPFSQTGWSNYFDGSSGYLRNTATTISDFGAANFTAEVFVYKVTSAAGFVYDGRSTSGNGPNFTFFIDSNQKIVTVFNGSTVFTSTAGVPLNQWTHVVICRGGTGSNQAAVFINGVRSDLVTISGTYSNGDNVIGAGAFSPLGVAVFPGYISNFRIVKGTDVYGYTNSTITVPTTPLTAISGTSLLTCQSNRFQDASSNNYALTVSGSPSVQAFSPFNPTAAWSAATNGGSGYFDGSGDYLNTPSSGQFAPSGDFTIAWWYYPTTLQTTAMVANYTGNNATDWSFETNSAGDFNVYLNGSTLRITASAVIKRNAWNYLVVSRSGSTVTAYCNNASAGTYTLSGTFGSASKSIRIGAGSAGTNNMFGYCAGVSLIDGTALDGTIPTAPPTAVSGTKLLLNFTNAGIYDATSKNDLETVGNAQISTTQSKFGGSSMYFDGTGDYLFSRSSRDFEFGTGDFTIEAWFYLSSTAGNYRTILALPHSAGGVGFRFGDATSYNSLLQCSILGTAASNVYSVNKSKSQLLNTWTHFALTRQGTTCRAFVNGVQENVGSGTNVTSFPNASFTDSTNIIGNTGAEVGRGFDANTTFIGYIQDVRITKGVARYTSTFTPPAAAFPVL